MARKSVVKVTPGVKQNWEDSLFLLAAKAGDAAESATKTARKTALETLGIGDLVAISTIHVATDVVAHGFKAVSTTSYFVAKETSGLVIRTLRELKEMGGSIGEVAVLSLLEGLQIGSLIGETSGHIAKNTILGGIHAVDEIGSTSGKLVRKTLLNTATLPHDLLMALLTGKTN